MSSLGCFISIASSNAITFPNATKDDLLISTQSNTQDILIGNAGPGASNTSSIMIASNMVYFNDDVICSGNLSAASNTITVGGNLSYGSINIANVGMYRNRVINGDIRVNQRGMFSVVTGTGTSNAIAIVDRFQTNSVIITGGITQSNTTLTSSDTPYQYGFRKGLRLTASTACSSYSNIDLMHYIEAANMEDFNWGTNSGLPVTLSFWLKTNATTSSNIPFSLRNGAYTHSYCSDATVVSTGNWQYVTQTVVAPPNGSTWYTGSNVGIGIGFGTYGSTTFRTASSNVWVSSNVTYTTGSINIWGTLNRYIEITGVQLEKGSTVTSFEYRPYAVELLLCQRYLFGLRTTAESSAWSCYGMACAIGATEARATIYLPVPMRSKAISLVTSQGTATYGGSTITQGGAVATDCLYAFIGGADRGFTSVSIIDMAPNYSTISLLLTGSALPPGLGGPVFTWQTKSCFVYFLCEIGP